MRGLEARTVDERSRRAAHGVVARLGKTHDVPRVLDRKVVDLASGYVAAEHQSRVRKEWSEAPCFADIIRVLEPSGIRGVVRAPRANEAVAAPSPAVLRVDEKEMGDVHGAAVYRLVAGGPAADDRDGGH